jgi:hypothetical protein
VRRTRPVSEPRQQERLDLGLGRVRVLAPDLLAFQHLACLEQVEGQAEALGRAIGLRRHIVNSSAGSQPSRCAS